MPLPLSCRYCGADSTSQYVVSTDVYGGRPGQAYFRCGACDIYYLYPSMSVAETENFYTQEFESYMAGRSGAAGGWLDGDEHVAANAHQVTRRMNYLEPRLPKTGRVLEMGCSSGFMLYPLAAHGLACFGVEPSNMFREYVASRGIACHETLDKLLDSPDGAEGFDLIIHFFVVDLVADPLDFLRRQIDLLRPGGRIVFEIPSADDPLYTLYEIPAYAGFRWSVEHPCYFTKASLTHHLNQLGVPYEVLLDQRYDLSNHLIWARDGKPGGMGRFAATLGRELEDAYGAALIRSGHADTLIGTIEKR